MSEARHQSDTFKLRLCLTFKARQVRSMHVAFKLKLTLFMKIPSKCHHNIIPYISLWVNNR